ncbi:MAG: ligase-associated DNA damage response endonuclease PdeM [Burkholderiaceae bacterium]
MNHDTTTISVGGQRLWLLPEKAAFLPETSTLLIADAHIGKGLSFRKLGVPVPHGTTAETLAALSALVDRWNAKRIVFLGDFLHSARAHGPTTMDTLMRWRASHAALDLTLVRGNHDDHAGDPPAPLGIHAVDEPLMHGELALCHHPVARAPAYVLAGHLHPGVGLGGRANDHLRLPCFWFGANVGVLPAFGAFTGLHTIRAATGDRVFAASDGRVIELAAARP